MTVCTASMLMTVIGTSVISVSQLLAGLVRGAQ